MYNREKIIGVLREIVEDSKDISPYVVIAQPRRIKGEIPAQKLDGNHGLHVDFTCISHGFCDIYGEKVDVARNYLIDRVLESGAKYLLFVGEDTVFPYDGFKKLHETAEANPNCVITGVYYMKMGDPMITVRQGNWIKVPNVDPGQLIEAWTTGMDAMLIPVEVLRQMKDEDPEIPFCCIANNIEDIPFVGEDNFFIHRLHRMGVKLLVDTNVQCLHVDLATGKYTAYPGVDLKNYFTNFPITEPLTLADKEYLDKRWLSRLPGNIKKTVEETVADLQSKNLPVKFNMGCGRDRIEGYISVDKYEEDVDIKTDLVEFQLPENCADEIFASHVLEHIYHLYVPHMLGNWYTGLKPGGKVVIEVPDLEGMCKEFVNGDDDKKYFFTHAIYGAFGDYIDPQRIENNTASFHVWGYYKQSLQNLLEQANFKNIEFVPSRGGHDQWNIRVEATK